MHQSRGGFPYYEISNLLTFGIDIDPVLKRMAPTYWHPQPDLPLPPQPSWIINFCADADGYARALQVLDDTYPVQTPIFNHPRAVMAARRDLVGNYLGNIPGLEVPRCRRFMASGPRSFSTCFEEGGFRYPVAIQQTEARNGSGRLWIANRRDLDNALEVGGGGGRLHVMIQGHSDETDPSPALRMVFVGRSGRSVALHRGISGVAVDPMISPSKAFLQSILRLANSHMPLDFWTMDVLVLAPDRLRLLDISAGLHVPAEADHLPHIREQAIELNRRLEPRLLALLGNPGQWRSDARSLPAVAVLKDRHGT